MPAELDDQEPNAEGNAGNPNIIAGRRERAGAQRKDLVPEEVPSQTETGAIRPHRRDEGDAGGKDLDPISYPLARSFPVSDHCPDPARKQQKDCGPVGIIGQRQCYDHNEEPRRTSLDA